MNFIPVKTKKKTIRLFKNLGQLSELPHAHFVSMYNVNVTELA